MTPDVRHEFPRIPAVVLAAGRSLRMGRIKALLPWPASGTPFVTHVTGTLRDAGADPVAVVTGAHDAEIAAVLAGTAVCRLFNPRHTQGQVTSLQRGLAWSFGTTPAEWTLVTLVDLPAVTAATVRALITAAAAAGPSVLAIRPAVDRRHGHPVVWRRGAWPAVQQADPSFGARSVMRALAAAGQVLDVPVSDEGVLRDIDTPEDYAEHAGNEN